MVSVIHWCTQHRRSLLLATGMLCVAGGILFAQLTAAATYTWDNDSGDGLWSTCTNWSTNVCPGSGDIAQFDGTETSNATIDGSFAGTVRGISINSGYTGTITQQRDLTIGSDGYVQNDGTFSQGTYGFDLNNSGVTIDAGTFTTGVGTTTIERNFTVDAAATYTSSSTRTWEFDGFSDSATFTFPGTFTGRVDIANRSGSGSFTLASGTTLPTVLDMTGNSGVVTINDGATMHVANNPIAGANLTISGQLFASSTVNLFGSFTLNATGEFYFDGTQINIERDYTDNGGTFDESGITFVFDGSSIDPTTFTFPGTFPGIVDIEKSSGSGSFTLASGTTLPTVLDMTGNSGVITINDGATMYVADSLLRGDGLIISGQLFASSTVNIDGSFTLNATGEFYFDGTQINIEENYTDNGGTFDESGITFVFDDSGGADTTFTFPGAFPGIVDIAKSAASNLFVLTTGTTISTMSDMTGNRARIVIEDGATMHVANNPLESSNMTISGQLFASSTVSIFGSFTLNATGEFYFDNTQITIENNYTDNGGTFDESGVTFRFIGFDASSDTTFTFPGVFPGLVDLDISAGSSIFNLASGTTITTTDTTGSNGVVIINGTIQTDGNPLEANTLTINDGATLAIYAGQTLTTPTLNPGSTVEYYGPSTYTTIDDYSFQNLTFSAGTYNLSDDITVAQDFTNTGATFNQTAGTTTLTGTANAITGDNTFHNLEKTASAASTLTFGAGDTQTITGELTLTGLDASNRLTLESSNPGSQWFIEAQGNRTLDFLAVSDGNSIANTIINCYDIDCLDEGNNTNIFFTPPLPTYRLQGGVRLHGGVRL